jgi:pimeloyl-ACP methyl ester carboxylesterase
MADERLQLREYGERSRPTLIYLPGLHGDWTLVASFRAALAGRAHFVECTYPRTTTWTLQDYAQGVLAALQARNISSGWLLGESFGSQVAWQIVEAVGRSNQFNAEGVILAGGFARYPFFPVVRMTRAVNRAIPMWLLKLLLRGYSTYAKLRHRRAPETLGCIDEFVARRTEEDRQAILHRYGLILRSAAEGTARESRLPLYHLSGLVDPVVPWPFVRPWLRKHCPGFRDSRLIFNADHNVLGTAPQKSAEQVLAWIDGSGAHKL